jgi:hypothetical protein
MRKSTNVEKILEYINQQPPENCVYLRENSDENLKKR